MIPTPEMYTEAHNMIYSAENYVVAVARVPEWEPHRRELWFAIDVLACWIRDYEYGVASEKTWEHATARLDRLIVIAEAMIVLRMLAKLREGAA